MFFFLFLLIFFNEVILIFNSLRNYVKDNSCKINIEDNQVHVMNYDKIVIFDDSNIVIKLVKKTLSVKGNDLIINKLMDDELLIKGSIKLIEIR